VKNIPESGSWKPQIEIEDFGMISAERKLDISSPPEYFAETTVQRMGYTERSFLR
jgi:hypothetical protein